MADCFSLSLGGRGDGFFLAAPTQEVLAQEKLHILSLSLPLGQKQAIQLVIIQKQRRKRGLSESI